jgi:N-dimethylarginine dimethylaminohydrolase
MMTGAGPYLEGGDLILRGNGKDILVGVDPYSTDQAGFDWLARSLASDGYKCWPVTFKMIEIHLLAHMNLIGPKLGIICRDAFKGHEHTFPAFLKDYDWIDISVEDVHNGGADVVMLNSKKALVSQAQPRVADELSKRGIEPQLVNIERASQASAGVRCMTIIVHREKA